MKKISELTAEEFFDVIYALSPVLPMITEMEVLQAQLFQNYNERITRARTVIATNTILLEKGGNPGKEDEHKRKIEDARQSIYDENAKIFARDISKIVPLLTSKENRGCIFNALSVIDGLPADEVRKYPAPKLIMKIKQIISDTDFKSFLSYAEESEATA